MLTDSPVGVLTKLHDIEGNKAIPDSHYIFMLFEFSFILLRIFSTTGFY